MATSPIGGSSGLGGSGIDVNAIVSQLMQIEQQPLTRLKQQEASYQTKISAYAALLASVTSFQTTVNSLKNMTVGMSASSSDTSYFSATGSNAAVAGTTPIQIANIASAQSLYSTRFGSQTEAVADLSGSGTQQIQVQVGNNPAATITVNSTNNTLSSIVSAINSAKAGVTASIVKESSNFVIDSTNDYFYFDDGLGNYYKAKLADGNYSGSGLATALATAMNGATPQGGAPALTNTFSVDYSTTTLNAFTIKTNAGSFNIDWGTSGAGAYTSIATPQQFGFALPTFAGAPAYQSAAITSASPLTSSVVDGTYKLSLVSNTTGTSNRVTVKVDETGAGNFNEAGANIDKYGLSALAFDPTYNASTGATTGGIANLIQSQVGLDAKLKVNGIEMYRSSNTITDAVTGVTLNLLKGDPNYGTASATNLNLNVTLDSGSLSAKLTGLVSAYNGTLNAISQLKGDQNQQGVLSGDSLLLFLNDAMTNMTTTSYGTSSNPLQNNLTYIGLTHTKDGLLQFDSSKLSAAYQTDSANITTMINNMASSMGSVLDNYVKVSIPAGQDGYKTMLKDAQSQETNMNEQLMLKQQSLMQEYMALDQILSQLNNTSNYLTQQMSALTKSNK